MINLRSSLQGLSHNKVALQAINLDLIPCVTYSPFMLPEMIAVYMSAVCIGTYWVCAGYNPNI